MPWALRVYAVATGLAAVLALVLALSARLIPAAVSLSRALAGLALFAAYFVLAGQVPFLMSAPLLRVLDYVGMVAFALGLSAWLEVSFSYPQPFDPEAYLDFTRKMRNENWLTRLGERAITAGGLTEKRDRMTGHMMSGLMGVVGSAGWTWGVAAIGGGLVALSQGLGSSVLVFGLGWGTMFAVAYVTAVLTFGAFEWQYRTGNAEDRARVTWLFLGLVISFYLWSSLWGGSMLWVIFGGGELAGQFFAAGLALALPGGAMVMVVLLGFSIFFFGAIDPRMAIRKTSVYGFAALLLAVALAIVQGSAATQLAHKLGLPGNTGLLLAAAMVGLVFAPLRNRIERRVERLVERVLPASTLADAHRETATVVFGDLSGYTELSAKDEPTALTLASLLHKESRRFAERHDGRLVKSIGDAVLLAFNDPGEAAVCCIELREKFAAATGGLGLPALPLHFGVHIGEVVRDQDGDIFGGTVNLAARLQGQAGPGEIVVSEAVASVLKAGNFKLQPLGEKLLKNVPTPVNCFLVS